MSSFFRTTPSLSRAAPRLYQQLFVCRRCLNTQSQSRAATSPRIFHSKRQTPFLHAFRTQTTHAPTLSSNGAARDAASPLSALSRSIGASVTPRTRAFPETSDRAVAYWLLGSAASVFGIVVFGGLTRLTESGLSITEWRPVTGSRPPMSAQDWTYEFDRYRASPEFKLLNPRMTLDEFKQIYWMEWTHRLWGRVVGLTFLLPTAYFIARRRVSAGMALKLTGICALIGFQGVLGWWMVKSGLKDDLFKPGSHPRVSQYRLTAHLGTAFVCYLAMLWNGLQILRENRLLNPNTLSASSAQLKSLAHPGLKPFRRSVAALTALVFVTALSGGLVAGLDAGLIYNEFPYMGLGLTPPKKELWDPWYSHTAAPHPDLWWRNMLENPSLVQLDHRVLATTTFCAVHALWAYARWNPTAKRLLGASARSGVALVLGLVWVQVTLGVSTLLYLVPTPLAAAHQAGALALLSGMLVLGSRVWVPKRAMRLLRLRMSTAGSKGMGVGGARGPGAVLNARNGGVERVVA
ncbi:hypothetical protein LTR28_007135 [Elasticomyces elasticus]|nr:hypothetical protein LTR28_007135 [Elasticomyces elasticus]